MLPDRKLSSSAPPPRGRRHLLIWCDRWSRNHHDDRNRCEFGTKYGANQNQQSSGFLLVPRPDKQQYGGEHTPSTEPIQEISPGWKRLESIECWERLPGRKWVWRSWLKGGSVIGCSSEQQVSLMSLMRTGSYAGSAGVVEGKTRSGSEPWRINFPCLTFRQTQLKTPNQGCWCHAVVWLQPKHLNSCCSDFFEIWQKQSGWIFVWLEIQQLYKTTFMVPRGCFYFCTLDKNNNKPKPHHHLEEAFLGIMFLLEGKMMFCYVFFDDNVPF